MPNGKLFQRVRTRGAESSPLPALQPPLHRGLGCLERKLGLPEPGMRVCHPGPPFLLPSAHEPGEVQPRKWSPPHGIFQKEAWRLKGPHGVTPTCHMLLCQLRWSLCPPGPFPTEGR